MSTEEKFIRQDCALLFPHATQVKWRHCMGLFQEINKDFCILLLLLLPFVSVLVCV